MEQHPNCRCEFEDFKESNTLIARCDVCFTLDGRSCIGGVHKRREQPAPAPGNYPNFIVLFTSHILHIYILFAYDAFDLMV
jgi:hypothetical protein